ncbi:MAG: enoyl-CoA hydratase-related protein [Candidatus Limnocylindrales bacterium]
MLVLTLDRPDALNALDAPLKAGLLAALRQAARDATVRAIVLTGAGRAFCAGQDLRETGITGAAIGAEVREHYNPLIMALADLPKPVVAAVNGVAAGAGLSLALACDIRLASDSATFICAFGRVGLVPDSGLSWFLPRVVGMGRALEMALTTAPIDATTAERIGLVNRVVPSADLATEGLALAARLADGPPMAMGLTKRALLDAQSMDLEQALEREAQLQTAAGRSPDHAEGVAAFVQKRRPRFGGL